MNENTLPAPFIKLQHCCNATSKQTLALEHLSCAPVMANVQLMLSDLLGGTSKKLVASQSDKPDN